MSKTSSHKYISNYPIYKRMDYTFRDDCTHFTAVVAIENDEDART